MTIVVGDQIVKRTSQLGQEEICLRLIGLQTMKYERGRLMQGLKSMLLREQKYLEAICSRAENGLKSSPDGHLRISVDKNKIRYYHCTTNDNGAYISKSNLELPRQLAQKKYNQLILKKAETRLKQIKKITKDYSDDEVEQIYNKLHKERQTLVAPVEPTWEQKMAQWYGEKYQGKEFYEGTAVIITEKGERVRSKSEKILADYFYRNNILY